MQYTKVFRRIEMKNRIEFCQEYMIINFAFNKVEIKYSDIKELHYTRLSIKNYFKYCKCFDYFPGGLYIELYGTTRLGTYKGYKVPFKYKNLSQIPPKLKTILEVED